MTFTSFLFKSARLAADTKAVSKGRVGQRLVNKAIGRTAGRSLNRLWR